MTKHTPGELKILEGFGQEDHLDPRYYIGSSELPQAVFATSGGNDKANAERLVLVWNGHDALLEAGEELKDVLNRVLDNIEGTGILGRFTSHTVSLAQQHWDKAAEGAKKC